MADRVTDIIARTFGLPPDAVTDDLEFGVTPGWDSVNHVNLMLALEEHFNLEFPERMLHRRSFSSIAAIRACVDALMDTAS